MGEETGCAASFGRHEREQGVVHRRSIVPVGEDGGDAQTLHGIGVSDDVLAWPGAFALFDPDLELDARAHEEQLIAPGPFDHRLAHHEGYREILRQQRVRAAVDQVGGREQDADLLACEIDHLLDRLGSGRGGIDVGDRAVEGQLRAIVVELLVHQLAGASRAQHVRPLDRDARRQVVVHPVSRRMKLLDRALRVHAEPLQSIEKVGHLLQDPESGRVDHGRVGGVRRRNGRREQEPEGEPGGTSSRVAHFLFPPSIGSLRHEQGFTRQSRDAGDALRTQR